MMLPVHFTGDCRSLLNFVCDPWATNYLLTQWSYM